MLTVVGSVHVTRMPLVSSVTGPHWPTTGRHEQREHANHRRIGRPLARW